MPLHNWNNVDAGIFHAFHTTWITEIQNSMNHGILPAEYYALAEQHMGGNIADILTLRVPQSDNDSSSADSYSSDSNGGQSTTAVLARPKTTVHEIVNADNIAELARTIAIRYVSSHRVVAMIEIISPANKDREDSVAAIVGKTVRALSQGIHVLLVDLLKPGSYDPHGLHQRLRQACSTLESDPEDSSALSILVSYQSFRRHFEAFIEFPKYREAIPAMPVFLSQSNYVNVPLEETYQRAWNGMPAFWRGVVETDTKLGDTTRS
jgi:hypothetical protein